MAKHYCPPGVLSSPAEGHLRTASSEPLTQLHGLFIGGSSNGQGVDTLAEFDVVMDVMANPRTADLEWKSTGLCQSSDVAVFFPERDNRTAVERAKAICMLCSVRHRCLDHAMTVREPAGVWGGTDEWERRRQWRAEGRRQRL